MKIMIHRRVMTAWHAWHKSRRGTVVAANHRWHWSLLTYFTVDPRVCEVMGAQGKMGSQVSTKTSLDGGIHKGVCTLSIHSQETPCCTERNSKQTHRPNLNLALRVQNRYGDWGGKIMGHLERRGFWGRKRNLIQLDKSLSSRNYH